MCPMHQPDKKLEELKCFQFPNDEFIIEISIIQKNNFQVYSLSGYGTITSVVRSVFFLSACLPVKLRLVCTTCLWQSLKLAEVVKL